MKQNCFYTKTSLLMLAILFAVTANMANLGAKPLENGLFSKNIRMISGTVNATDGTSLIGASVAVKGTGRGTVTDINGSFSIDANDGDVLVISYTGYETRELSVGDLIAAGGTIILEDAASTIDQVVVVGYGTETRRASTGAISKVSGADLSRQPTLTAMQALQGLTSGIQVIGSGEPGRQPRVQIRGIGTVLTNENPLYVVDGVLTDDITNISTADIVSVDVLKDGSAAIYGSRAANGVVLITTKRGKSGKPLVTFDMYYGFRQMTNVVKMADAQTYAKYTNDALAYDNLPAAFKLDTIKNSTDWFDEISKRGLVQNYNLGISGGSDAATYLFSVGYFGDEGVLKTGDFGRLSLRSNNEFKLSKYFKVGNVLNATFSGSENAPLGVFADAYREGTTAPVYSGTYKGKKNYGFVPNLSVSNPVATIELSNNHTKKQRYQGNIYGEYAPFAGMTFRSSVGFDRSNEDNQQFTPTNNYGIFVTPVTELRNRSDNRQYYVWDNVASYIKGIGEDHVIRLTAGHSAERDRSSFFNVRAANVPEKKNLWYIKQGDQSSIVAEDGGLLLRRESVFGRLNYSFRDKYNLSGILRRDGSSAFPTGNKWGTFYSVGASWVISEEGFMKGNEAVKYLKLRGSYGKMGNDGISRIRNNELSQLVSLSNTNPYGFPTGLVNGITKDQIRDAAASWETTKSIDAGLEFGLGEHLTGELAYYNKLTTAYIFVPTPTIVDVDGIVSPAADVRNKGIEASLKWSNKVSDDFGYFVSANATFNRNNVEKVESGGFVREGGLGNGQSTTKTVEGEEIGSFWVLQTDGIYRDTGEISNSAHFFGAQPGDLKYKDINDDGFIDDSDRVFAGSYQPKVFYGIGLGIDWRGLDFSVDAYGVAGNKVYNGKKGIRFGNDGVEESRAKNAWSPTNKSGTEPRASNGVPYSSTYYVEKGDFFRINNITLGYTFKQDFFRENSIAKARVYVSAQNPVLTKKFSGFSSELPGSNALNSGIELGVYPTLATYLVGVNIGF